MLFAHAVNLITYIVHLDAGTFYRGIPVPLSLPALHVPVHLVITTLLLVDIEANLTQVPLYLCLIDQLEPTRLTRSVLLVALLAEVSPAPIAAAPACLIEVAHGRGGASARRRHRIGPRVRE